LNNKLDKILCDSINYLKFKQDYNPYNIYSDNINTNIKSAIDFTIDTTEVEKNNKQTVVKDNYINRENIDIKLIREDWMDSKDLNELNENICNCKKCSLGKSRNNFVFGVGNPDAKVVVIGEAPGADEDKQGKPFVGRAGQLLTDILKAINFTREEVFICNILKCRPPDNRTPLPEEIYHCEPYLLKQLEIIKPKMILAVGASAGQTLLKKKEPLGKMRGKFYDFHYAGGKAKLLVTFHPAALLRNPNWKRPTWEDVQLFRKEYDKE
jgi:uracil-DNA glycosylase